MKFEEKLIILRKQKALSQEQLAEQLNVTRQTISKWELGQSRPDMEKLIEMSKLFEIGLEELTNDKVTIEEKTVKVNELEKNKEEILSEEKYQKNKNKIALVALIVIIIGLLFGGILIKIGLYKQKDVDLKYSDKSKITISDQLEAEKKVLEAKKAELESKGLEYDSMAKYTDGEKYDLKIITEVLNPSFPYYRFDEFKDNPLTSKYCSLKNESEYVNNDFNKEIDSYDSIPFYALGGFTIVAFCMISGVIYMMSKRRDILAFSVQQIMPVAQEGFEKITPSVSKMSKTIMKEMSPSYGELAKEISKGIKEGMEEESKIYCKYCKEELDADSKFCSNCGKEI